MHVLVGTREEDYHERYRKPDKLQDGEELDWPVPFWFVDAGAALMLLLLAAIDEGLAAGVSGIPKDAAASLRSAFGIPEDVELVALVTIGEAAADPGLERGDEPPDAAAPRAGRGRPLGALVS